jgi:hypothetical protein
MFSCFQCEAERLKDFAGRYERAGLPSVVEMIHQIEDTLLSLAQFGYIREPSIPNKESYLGVRLDAFFGFRTAIPDN